MLLFIANERLHSANLCGAFKTAPIVENEVVLDSNTIVRYLFLFQLSAQLFFDPTVLVDSQPTKRGLNAAKRTRLLSRKRSGAPSIYRWPGGGLARLNPYGCR